MEMNMREAAWFQLRRNGIGQGMVFLALCGLQASQFTNPTPAQSEQRPVVLNPSSSGSKLAQSKAPTPTSEEAKPRKENGEEGVEKEKEKEREATGKKTVSSLILTVKLALLEDPHLFPYEIEVEGGSDEIILTGKVPTEVEKATAAKIAGAVPTVKSVLNKLEVVKELSELVERRQDDTITRHVKERYAQSATITAANFDVKTEHGVVSLSGTVRFQVIVLEAAEAARQVPGVKAVKTDKVKIESEG
jgi:hyperosmotically inducible periplasmic protein